MQCFALTVVDRICVHFQCVVLFIENDDEFGGCYGKVNTGVLEKRKCEDSFFRLLISRENHIKLKPRAVPSMTSSSPAREKSTDFEYPI